MRASREAALTAEAIEADFAGGRAEVTDVATPSMPARKRARCACGRVAVVGGDRCLSCVSGTTADEAAECQGVARRWDEMERAR